MNIKIADIEAVVEKLNRYYDISVDVDISNTFFRVYADTSKAINEFEARLIATSTEWEDEANELLNGVIFLNSLVDFVDHRDKFEPLVGRNEAGTWTSRYTGLTFTDQD